MVEVDFTETEMEPQLSYMFGYPVTHATEKKITFEGGSQIENEDADLKIPHSRLKGMGLATVVVHPGDSEDPAVAGKTRLIFNQFNRSGQIVGDPVEVLLTTGQFTVADPRFPTVSRPGTAENPMGGPVILSVPLTDPREAEGPEEGWEAAQLAVSNVVRTEIYQRDDENFDWRGKAGNNKIVATSGGQGFTNHHDAARAAISVFPAIVPVDAVDDE